MRALWRRRRRRGVVGLAVGCALAVAVTGCTGGHGSPSTSLSPSPSSSPVSFTTLADYYGQHLRWSECDKKFECTNLTVPLDYDDPAGRHITVAVLRVPATDSKARIGSLVVNPGGPGGSGIEYAEQASQIVTAKVRARFDVVGFDPRGVGQSTPVRCLTGKQLDHYLGLDPTLGASALSETVTAAKAFAAGCEAKSGPLLAHVGTENAARDMDVLRAALGDAKLTFLGKSYGTYLGALYADLFPSRVRALVLDGAVDPSLSEEQLDRVQAEGFETALDAFIADCVTRSSCPLGTSVSSARATLDGFLNGLRTSPLPVAVGGDGRTLNSAWGLTGIATALYDREYGWPALRQSLALALQRGDGSGLMKLADLLVGRNADGSYSNQTESNMAISCVDRPSGASVEQREADARSFAASAPHFGAMLAWGTLPCTYWPVPPVSKPGPLRASGAPPLLVVSTTRDPATPYAWGVSLAKQLSSGVLLTYDGDGHTAYRSGSSCIDSAVDDYLISLKVPATGARC